MCPLEADDGNMIKLRLYSHLQTDISFLFYILLPTHSFTMKLSLFLTSVAITCAMASPCNPDSGDGARIKPTILYGSDGARITQPATGDPNAQDNGPVLPQPDRGDSNAEDNGPRITSLIIDPVPTGAPSKAVQPTRGPDGGAPQMKNVDGADRWL